MRRRRRFDNEEDGADAEQEKQKNPVAIAEEDSPDGEIIPQNEGERVWLEEWKRGNPSTYTPDATLQSLMGYMPALATDSSPLGRAGTVMANLRALSWAEPFDSQASRLAALDNKKRLEWDGALLFSHLDDKAEISKITGREVQGPDETVRATILETAVMGRYEAPEFVGDVKGRGVEKAAALARSVHRLADSYGPQQTRSFEEKLASLMPGVSRGAPKPPAAAAKGGAAPATKGGAKGTAPGKKGAKAKA
jgi:hypothetical protein